jgi:hypothetical protein
VKASEQPLRIMSSYLRNGAALGAGDLECRANHRLRFFSSSNPGPIDVALSGLTLVRYTPR